MPRKRRPWESNMCHHVMLRGIDGRQIFNDDQDRTRFLLLLQEASELCHFKIHAFCLMGNHIHLMIEPTTVSLAIGVHRFAGRYARHFNSRHLKRGYVFQGRFRSIIVQDGGYVRKLARYIHVNPVEANLVTHPSYYQWSSYGAYLGSVEYTWLRKERVLSCFAITRAEAIEELVIHTESKVDANLDSEEIRKALRKGAFGNQEFVKTYTSLEGMELGEKVRADEVCTVDSLVSIVCNKFGVTLHELCSSEKRRELVQARGVLARAAQIKKGLNSRIVGEALQKSQGTLSRLAAAVRKDQELENLTFSLVNSYS